MSLILSGTNGLSDVDGSAATPAIRGTDANTGIFFPAADTIAFAEGGVEAMRLDSSGNLGLGVTPSAWVSGIKALQFGASGAFYNATNDNYFASNSYYDGSNFKRITAAASGIYGYDGTWKWLIAGSSTAGSTISFTQAMTLDASGNLGVGTTSPSSRLHLYDTAPLLSATSSNNSSGLRFNVEGTASTVYRFQYGGSTLATIDSSGNLLVGQTSASQTTVGSFMKPNGEFSGCQSASTNGGGTQWNTYSTGAGAYRFYVGMGGTVFATSTTITGISDQRLKENIRDLDDGLDVVMALKPRKFDWKEGKGADIKNARGFIAQEFEQVLPDMIDEWKDPAPEGEEPYKAVNANLIPTLVKAIQEQQAIITQLQADVAALKGQA